MTRFQNKLAEAAHLFEKVIGKTDQENFSDLNPLMVAFPHLHLRDGFKLDAYYAGCEGYAVMKLYARALDSTGRYMPVAKEEMDTSTGVINWNRADTWEASDPEMDDIIPFTEGQYIHNVIPIWASATVPGIEGYLEFRFIPEAIWEAVMLADASSLYLKHRRLGCRINGMLVVDDASLCISSITAGMDRLPLKDCGISPSVEILSESEAIVKYCFWNLRRGIAKRTIKVTKMDSGISLETIDIESLNKNIPAEASSQNCPEDIIMMAEYGDSLFWHPGKGCCGGCRSLFTNNKVVIDLRGVDNLKEWYERFNDKTHPISEWSDEEYRIWKEEGSVLAGNIQELLPKGINLTYIPDPEKG